MRTENVKLGEGIYTASDAAKIFKLPYGKIHYWFKKYMKEQFESSTNFRYYFVADDSIAVNFYTLIEMYVFQQLRQKGINSKKIVAAHKVIGQALETPYPFASAKILVSGKNILFEHKDGITSADISLQYLLDDIILPFSQKIEFGEDDIARKYYPLGKNKSVVVDPEHQFGQPTIEGTNITVDTLSNLHESGEEISFIAKLYNLNKQQVQDAIEFANAA